MNNTEKKKQITCNSFNEKQAMLNTGNKNIK